ncbi:LacI family DNA-binding transcriptional regulator [Candidatus Caldatribacterium sp.]|uniref:LacI family DNA-binding transcriptional regulator n=1 Tax=Candidatus Caldatribacterium sp. TaxID=2282143 RepID=UPI00299A06C9|nr:LacI family DNA-binding transcriptional regulator [Candidatus Caldatribacterium sp.]MDW8081908.1 LacI family DNA-binding transcriptional regulator [Candidatus Calescibacterium sp.]
MGMATVTIKDVAKKAGVTVTTVSRVLNNRGYISEATREKVYRAMKELNYQPNEIARSLLRRRTHILGIILPTVAHPFFSELAFFIEYYAYEYGYKVMLCNSQLDQKKEKEYVDMLRGNQVDGIIMASHTLEVDEYLNLKLPLVTFDRQLSQDIPFVSSDNYLGGTLATNLLIDKGCRKIAHICGNLRLNMLANQRNKAFVATAQARKVEYVTIETDLNVFDISQYDKLVLKLFEEHPDVEGVFAGSDVIAASVIKVCHQKGKKIPEEIKVVGYDDVSIASLTTPQLTTIRQPIEEMGKLAVELIHRQINKEKVAVENVLPVTLVERGTT